MGYDKNNVDGLFVRDEEAVGYDTKRNVITQNSS